MDIIEGLRDFCDHPPGQLRADCVACAAIAALNKIAPEDGCWTIEPFPKFVVNHVPVDVVDFMVETSLRSDLTSITLRVRSLPTAAVYEAPTEDSAVGRTMRELFTTRTLEERAARWTTLDDGWNDDSYLSSDADANFRGRFANFLDPDDAPE